jgi:molybdopterin-containing oxidoreductase family membrane subunit
MRKVSKLEGHSIQHIELMNIVIMITGSIVGVAYITELFIAWYSGVEYEQYAPEQSYWALLVGVFNDDVL